MAEKTHTESTDITDTRRTTMFQHVGSLVRFLQPQVSVPSLKSNRVPIDCRLEVYYFSTGRGRLVAEVSMRVNGIREWDCTYSWGSIRC